MSSAAPPATTFVGLLRGINVGTAKRVGMADLRALLNDLGYGEVRTLLQSGNAVFTAEGAADAVAGAVERALEQRTGVSARCLVRTADELLTEAAAIPFDEPDGKKVMVFFLSDEPGAQASADLAALDPGRVEVAGRVAYQWCPEGLLAAPDLGGHAAKRHGLLVTARNANTVRKLAAMVGA